jgi:hypothetical protein
VGGIYEVFCERSDDSIAPCQDLTDVIGILAGRFDHPARGRVDNGADSP